MADSSADGTLRFERTIRVPPTVSAHAQAVIAAGQQMVVDRLDNPAVSPPLDDADAWKAHIAFMDEAIVTGFARRGRHPGDGQGPRSRACTST